MEEYKYSIINYWQDNNDLYVDYTVIYNDKEQAHACSLFDINDLNAYKNGSQEELLNELTELLNKNNGNEFNLPKTSELNQITYDIYKELCQSDNNMLYIDDDDDLEQFNLNTNTYLYLCDDIEKFNLRDYFSIEDNMLIVYGGLQCCFNDDRERGVAIER